MPLLLIGLGLAVLLPASLEPKELTASSSSRLGQDDDRDGVANAGERVLGTDPDSSDSDRDGYGDLEELARNSDPLSVDDVPEDRSLDVGMYAYVHDDMFALHTAIYVKGALRADLNFEFGFVKNGRKWQVSSNTYSSGTMSFISTETKDPLDRIFVIEMPIPRDVAMKLREISFYSIVRDFGAGVRDPAVSLVNIVQQGDTLVQIVDAPDEIKSQYGGGVVYKPLSSERTPETVPGQLCYQRIAPVGTRGANVQYEVEKAECADFDSSCAPGDCSAKVGKTLELPDPGNLLGG